MSKEQKYLDLAKENKLLSAKIAELEKSLNLQSRDYNHLLGLYNNSKIGMVICSLEGKFLNVNNHFAYITGYPKDELYKMTFREITYPEDVDSDLELVRELLEGKRSNFQLEKRYVTKDNKVIWVNLLASLVLGPQEEPEAIIGTVEEITKRKKILNELEKSKLDYKRAVKLLQSIQDAIPDIIGVQDADHNIVQYNEAGYKFLNKSYEEVVGKKCYNLIGRSKKCIPCSTTKAIETRQPSQHEKYFPELDTWLDIRAYPIFNEKNEIIYLVEHLRDITKVKKLELKLKDTIENLEVAKLKAEESDNLKTAFLHNISHEIRTPLNGIIGFSELLKGEELDRELIRKYSDIISMNGWQLANIISDLIAISTIESGQEKVNIKNIYLQHLLENIYSSFEIKAKNKNISFHYNLNIQDIKYISTDETKLNQILSNLLSNAMKFTHRGSIELGVKTENNHLVFHIKDTGIGIKKEDHEKIFKRFRQANSETDSLYGGSGLGLSISKAYVELLGGEIWLESKPGEGSTFYFSIPLMVRNGKDKSEKKNKNIDVKTILIAEDDEANYLYFAEVVKNLNIKLLHAKNGQEAISFCKKDDNIDLIFMDIKMPLMNGHEAAKNIKSIKPDVPIIAISAYFESKEKEISLNMGCTDYLTKPVKKEDIINRIQKIYI